jgi:hypothetical protein
MAFMNPVKPMSAVLILSVMFFLASCASRAASPTTSASVALNEVSSDPVEAPREEHHLGAGTVTHVVFIWLKKPGDADTRKSLIESSKALKAIPGVVDVHAGPVLPSTRPVVDSSYDVGVVFTFTDARAMQDYLVNPVHLKLLNEVIKPNADHYKVYDFTNE